MVIGSPYNAVCLTALAPEPSGHVAGYEDTAIGDGSGKHLPAPDWPLPPATELFPEDTTWVFPAITEDEAREAFLDYVSSNTCYSRAPAKEMVIQKVCHVNAFKVELWTR
ncbi:protein SSUH2 homolog [Pseudophryne corroboree]|uniref:protein SSUH2 homolog n=1 Tax=Pseudophryne corroboree TaxID=495146 RepID=UPI0030815F64